MLDQGSNNLRFCAVAMYICRICIYYTYMYNDDTVYILCKKYLKSVSNFCVNHFYFDIFFDTFDCWYDVEIVVVFFDDDDDVFADLWEEDNDL